MKAWKKRGRRRSSPMGPQASRSVMTLEEHRKRDRRNERRDRARKIAAKRKVVPGGIQS